MGRRSRPFGGSSGGRRRGGRGRRDPLTRFLFSLFVWRTVVGKVAAFGLAVQAHPLVFAFAVVFVTIWYQSGSGWVALTATPALWGAGAVAWFHLRARRTGVTVQATAAAMTRERRVRRQWGLACDAAGLTEVPDVRPWAVRSEGETVVVRFDASGSGVTRDSVLAGLEKMRQVIGGGCRSAQMRALGDSGVVEVRFKWDDPLDRVIRPNDIPAAPKGVAPFGLSESGPPVGFRILNDRGECVLLPTLITGMSGSGKSFTLWSLLLGFILEKIPVRLWVADPAGGVELSALQDAQKDGGSNPYFVVHRYADTQAGIARMAQEFHDAMMTRSKAAKFKRQRAHVPTLQDPVNLFICDELLWCDELIKTGKAGPLGRAMTGGRKFGFTVLGLTQLAKVEDLKGLRDLFLLRIVMKVKTREGVEAALGAGQGWAESAPAHRIPRTTPGVGYVVDAEGQDAPSDEAVRFRSVFLEDEQVAQIARGEVPSGVERFAREEVDGKRFRHCHYRLYDAHMGLVYTGETNNFEQRMREHRRRSPWWGEVVQDSDHMHQEWHVGPTAKDAYRKAKAAETEAIRTEFPRHNDAENQRNPFRVIRGGKGRAA